MKRAETTAATGLGLLDFGNYPTDEEQCVWQRAAMIVLMAQQLRQGESEHRDRRVHGTESH